MERLTKKSKDGKGYVIDSSIVEPTEEGYRGRAVNKLAGFENFYDQLIARQDSIPEELDKLRRGDKTKTLRFRELLAQKITIGTILADLRQNGLE